MIHLGIAPCSLFSVSRDLMLDAAALVRHKLVYLHSHLV